MESREQVAERWSREGYSCELWVDPPGQVWSDFVHDVDEWVQVMEGTLEMSYQGQTVRLGPGEACHIPAGARHTVRNVGGATARWLYGYRRTYRLPVVRAREPRL